MERRRENRWNNPVIREKEASLFEDLSASGAELDEFVNALRKVSGSSLAANLLVLFSNLTAHDRVSDVPRDDGLHRPATTTCTRRST